MHPKDFTPGWDPVHIGVEGAALSIGGVNPWLHASEWHRVHEDHIVVPHPTYPHERRQAWVYEITTKGQTTRFAAAELSNGVWGFYVPRPDTA